MIVSKEQKLGFGFIRHTATSSIQRTLIGSGQWSEVNGSRHRMRVPPKFRSYSWHVVVRNPYYRVWSLYNFFRQKKNNRKGQLMAKRVKKMSFHQFVKNILIKGSSGQISSTQSRSCSVLQPDVILKFEDIPDCLFQLPWWPCHIPLPWVNEIIRNSLKGADRKGLELVREWAKKDFEQFGYDDELPC